MRDGFLIAWDCKDWIESQSNTLAISISMVVCWIRASTFEKRMVAAGGEMRIYGNTLQPKFLAEIGI